MSGVYQLAFTPEKKVTLEAMRLAGKTVFRGWTATLSWLHLVFICVLAPAGAVAFFLMFRVYRDGAFEMPGPWLAPLLYFLVGIAGLWVAQAAYGALADASVRSRFSSASEVEIGPEGFVLKGPDSIWQTGWRDVEAVVMGRNVVAVVVGAVALPVPVSAFASAAEAKEAFAQMQGWQAAARS